eukprot:TRINITY_DN10564_c0_g2_i2.p1 TRINITY_DN10564_c0_g2~~TRINITY_DN10564_c0_g2_i2.p1  ORF type:complete len:1185 (+),score=621.48 TRINITY_DN10564_c0_g2_i2:46-3600(+)
MEEVVEQPPTDDASKEDESQASNMSEEEELYDTERKEAAMHGSVIKLSADVKKLTDENTKLKIQLKRISGGTDVDEMVSLEELKRGKAEAEAKLKETLVRLEGTLSRATSAEAELDAALKRNQTLAQENQTYLKESLEQGKQSKELITDRNKLQAKVSELEVRLSTTDFTNNALKETNEKLQKQLEKVEQEYTTAISKLRQEKEALMQDLHTTKGSLEEKTSKYKQAMEDYEALEDIKKNDLESLRNDVALYTNKLSINEDVRRQLEASLKEKVEEVQRKDDDIKELNRLLAQVETAAEESRRTSSEELEKVTTARNLAEHEVVKLKSQLNSIHPMLQVDGEVASPFSFGAIVEIKEELELTKGRLQQIQGLYKNAIENKEHDAKMLDQERTRTDQLAQRVIDLQYELSQMRSERDAAIEWKEMNQVAVDRADDISRTNEMLSSQLQYLLHEGRQSDDGTDDLLSLEYNGIKEIQEKNTELSALVITKDREHKRDIEELKRSMKTEFEAELDKVSIKMKRLEEERATLNKELQASREKCKRLAMTLEDVGRYKRLLTSSAPTADMPASGARVPTPSEEENKLSLDLQKQRLSDDLAEARTEIDKLKAEIHEMQRRVDTIEANRQHMQSLYHQSLNNEKHLVQERDYYKAQAQLSDKASDESLQMLLESQNKLKESHVKVATLEAQLQMTQHEVQRLSEVNASLMESKNRIEDVLVQVNGVKSFIEEHKAVSDAQVKSERDEARQTLSKREEELSNINNMLRAQRAKHEQEITDLTAQLATAREQLASTSHMLEVEREQHKQQILRNKKLANDLDISEAERKHLKQADAVEGETNYTKPTHTDLQAINAELEGERIKCKTLQTTIDGLKDALRSLEEMSRSSQTNLKNNAQEIADLKTKLEAAEKQEQDRQAEWTKRQAELTAREESIKKTEAEQKAKMDDLVKRNEDLQRELDEGEEGRREANTRCAAAEEEASTTRRNYEEAIFSKAELMKELQLLKEKDGMQLLLPTGRLTLQQETEHREEMESLRAELDKVHSVLAAMEPSKAIEEKDSTAVIDCMRSRNKELEERLRAEKLELQIMRAQNDQLRRQATVTMQNTQSEITAKLERRIENLKEEIKESRVREEQTLNELKGMQAKCEEWKEAGNLHSKLKLELQQKTKDVQDAIRQGKMMENKFLAVCLLLL